MRNAGTFKHTPGMIVLQALADAGGADVGTADTSKAIEGIRETERLREAADKRDRLLVKQARLRAQLDDADIIEVPASIKSRLSETAPLNAVIAGAAATLTAERKSYQQQQALAERQVAIARVEIEAQNTRAEQLKTLSRQENIHPGFTELDEIVTRGSVFQLKPYGRLRGHFRDYRMERGSPRCRGTGRSHPGRGRIAQSKLELEHTVGPQEEIATAVTGHQL